MKKILIINTNQLGMLTDTLKYCEHLGSEYKIKLVCYDYGYEKVKIPNVKVVYVPHPRNRLLQGILFLLYACWCCALFEGFIFVVFFPYCEWLRKILFWKKMHLDIRTITVTSNDQARLMGDRQIIKAINSFNTTSYISEGVKQYLGTNAGQKSFILPLGADIISYTNKTFDDLKLLYVGTLNNRNIIDTIKGIKKFKELHQDVNLSYDIVGSGDEYDEINDYICNNGLNKMCKTYGRIEYYKLKSFFDKCNVGVSYIPLKSYYQNQPPTKTFEYGLSGQIVIATETISNKEVINENNGLLIKDDPNSFYEALEVLIKTKHRYNSNTIRESMKTFKWEHVINKYLIPIIES